MPFGPAFKEEAGRSANQPASPESGVLGVGGMTQAARSDVRSASRPTQPAMSCCHSSVLQAPPGARTGPSYGAADPAVGAATAHAIDATTMTSSANTIALARRTMSDLHVG